ncbi:YceI family protein [Trinickia caryophylli]|uniref:Polyisoprenoid-binding protein YceI n=1 Tax=Trinickia caryophylli TaxID=28094 RepID=A0A1X7G4V2_TRICW|nr:YceI family protein [Trinickia caryophylli]TRX14290.1 YceI family protein [Trinickia caryophylli]GLU33386.1 polyisoprenoid-binding protein [Trinickia caryophylli]SMF63988.1 Polyisoprenoid-binding protein YceI [Trinickia caryophylli]
MKGTRRVGWASVRVSLLAVVAMGALSLPACTPLRVVTHSVDANEASVPAGRYSLDEHHWSIVFDVDHLKYSRFAMRFDKASATLDWKAGGLDASSVDVSIDASSVDTNVPLLDKLVKGHDMLDVGEYPSIRFVSRGFARKGAGEGELRGDLTIHGVTRPVVLDVKFNGYGVNPLTKEDTLGFSAQGHFSRAQFGLATWYPAVGDELRVRIEAEFARHAVP